MRTRVLLIGALLAACGRFGFDVTMQPGGDSGGATGDSKLDAPADACALGPWSAPAPAAGLASADDDWDSAVHPDGTYVVFSRRAGGTKDLYGATVTGTTFGTPIALGVLNSTFDDEGPGWSPDGATLYFVNTSSGTHRVYTSTFDGNTFTSPAIVASLAATVVLGPSVTPDDLELYYSASQASPELHRATRATPADAWQPQGIIAELNSTSFDGYATISADGREIYWDSGRSGVRSLWTATRSGPGALWGTPTIATEFNASPALTADPELSRDGRMLLFSSNRTGSLAGWNLWFAMRSCL